MKKRSLSGTFGSSLFGLMVSLGVLSVGFPNKAVAAVITRQSSNVKAELYYQKEGFKFKNLRLKIVRSGRTLLDQPVPMNSNFDGLYGSEEPSQQSFAVRDLDGDKEPEVIMKLFTGGAHCCSYFLIYRYQASPEKYTNLQYLWGDTAARPEIIDLDGDGVPEFKSRDSRFAYAFTSYANSSYPLQVWQYRQGKMIDVTRSYPRYIKENLASNLNWLQRLRREQREEKGGLAAYLADKYLLGEEQDGWQRLQREYQGRDRQKFFADLRNFLQKNGYTSSSSQIATRRSPSSGQQTSTRRSPIPVQTYSDTRALGMAQFLQGKQELISAQEKLQLAAKGQYETINIPKTDFLDKKITDRKGSGCIPLLPCSDDKKISYADYLQLKLKVNGQAQTHKNSLKVYQEIENYRRRLESDKRLGGQDSANGISSIFNEANRKAERQLQQRQGQVFSLGNISALTVDSFLESLKLVVAGAKFDGDIAPAIIRVYVAARSRGSLTVSQAENIVQSFQSRGISPEGLKRRADYLKEMSDIMPQAIEAFKDKDIKKQQNLIIQTYNETASLVKSENLLTKGTAIYTGFVKLQESNEKLKNLENTLNELTKAKLIDERDKSYIEWSIYSAQWDYFSSYISLFESIAKSFGADKAKQFQYWEEGRKTAESIKTGLSNARDNLAELALRDDYQRLVTQYEKNQIIISASSPAIDSIADEIGKYLLKARTDVVTRRPDGTIAVSINGVVSPP